MTPRHRCEFQRAVVIAAPVEDVFAFHADPNNITAISPAWQSVVVERSAPAAVGGEFAIAVHFLGVLPMRWRGIWREVDAPGLLVDEASQSPFSYWRHRHVFERIDAGTTRMTDHVTYAFPGGWLGKGFGETVGRWQFAMMFANRHARTRAWLEKPGRAGA